MAVKILLVDDATFIREILRTLARKQGWQVIGEAENGEEAITKALELEPDVILMDVVMPKMSGIEAAKHILRKRPSLPIIGLSTLDEESVMAQAIEAGFVSYISKPFDNHSVITAVTQALQKRERKSG